MLVHWLCACYVFLVLLCFVSSESLCFQEAERMSKT